MKHLLYFIALCTASCLAFAQTAPVGSNNTHQCGTDIVSHKLWQEQPHLQELNTHLDNAVLGRISSARASERAALNPDLEKAYTIPVVVHIVHDGGSENISDSQVMEGIRYLNAAFTKLPVLSTPEFITFELCMARQDDKGMPTSGITRTQSPLTAMVLEYEDTALKNLIRWNPKNYLNIWVVRDISSASEGTSIASYAYLPSSHGNPEDGLVVESRSFGTSPEASRAAAHALGHYLGLYHTFEGGCTNNNCLLDGDRVCDTPPDASAYSLFCDSPVNSCSSDIDDLSNNNPFRPVDKGGSGDQPDLRNNYMDYGNTECFRDFTSGQVLRMEAMLWEVRKSLLASPGCQLPCTATIVASFTTSKSHIFAGEEITFTNTSIGANQYQWYVDNIDFATSQDASYKFLIPGIYIIRLEASNGDAHCMQFASDTIVVSCPTKAVIAMSAVFIQPGGEVNFTNNSTGTKTSTWYIDGQQTTSAQGFSQIFTKPGGHPIMLVVTGEYCNDTAYAFVNVGTCSTREADMWYFGNHSGLDFATDPPTVLDDGQTDTPEGSASICNSTGQLLFYTDGITVWDRLHRVMPGGNNTLGGHKSATQSALIVPHPGNAALYYIFTVDARDNGYINGLSYAVVDMSRNSGTGEVVLTVMKLREQVCEKLTAVTHSNGRDIWVLVRGINNEFYSYRVSDQGLVEQPVVSTVKRVYKPEDGLGAMKASPIGKHIAIANFTGNMVEVYPFDASTGIVSEGGSLVLSGIGQAYGVEFSRNGSYLYCGKYTAPHGLIQYDLTAGSPDAIINSDTFLPSLEGNAIGALQLASNGKIYVARENSKYMGVVEYPDKPGAECSYQDYSGIKLPNPMSLGLPSFIQSAFARERGAIAGPTALCIPANASYTLAGLQQNGYRRWQYRGKAAFAYSQDSSSVTLSFRTPGVDTLVAMYSSGCSIVTDTLLITADAIPIVSLGRDTAVCDNAAIVFDPGEFASYVWHDNSTARTFSTTKPGKYWVTVTTRGGCTVSDTVVVGGVFPPAPKLGADTSVCTGGVVVLDAGPGFRRYRWQDGSQQQQFTAYKPGKYWVAAQTVCGYTMRDTIVVAQAPVAMPTSGDITVCAGESTQIAALGAVSSVLWMPSEGLDDPTSPTPTASPLTTTTYTVRGTNAAGCATEGKVTVKVSDKSQFVLMLPDTTAIPGSTIEIPLRMEMAQNMLPIHMAELRINIRYRAALLMAQSSSVGSLATARDGDYEIASITLSDLDIKESISTLAVLTFSTFLGDALSTALALENIDNGNCLSSTLRSGSFAPTEVCSLPIRRIRMRDTSAPGLAVAPNPASDRASALAITSEEGAHTLALYNMQGQLLWQETFAHTGNRSAHSLPIDLQNIPAGLYQVVLTTPSQATTQTLSIVK